MANIINIIFLVIFFIGVIQFYRSYVQRPLAKWSIEEVHDSKETFLLDIRDYNVSYKSPIKGAYNLPSAYIKRYHSELPKKDLVLATTEIKSVRADARYLKRKGYNIVGFVDVSEPAIKECLAACC